MSKAQQAYEALKTMIQDGTLAANHLYSENQLAASLGISRTPVREAIRMLESEGCVNVLRGSGIRIQDVTPKEMLDLLPLRYMLESYAMQEAIRSIPSVEYERMLAKWTDAEGAIVRGESVSTSALTALDRATHQLFVEYAGNQILQQLIDFLNVKIDRFRTLSVEATGDGLATIRQHIAMLQAMQAGSLQEATAIMETHMRQPWEIMCERTAFHGDGLQLPNTNKLQDEGSK